MFTFAGDTLSAAPAFRKDTLAEPHNIRGRQVAGTVHVHPNGRFVYAVNRASSTVESAGERVFAGGENTFAVYSINPTTGEPSLLQHVDTHGIHCRTFHIDPSGRLLVAAHIILLSVREGAALRTVPASSPSSGSMTPAGSTSSASMTSMSATGPCSGWAWSRCKATSEAQGAIKRSILR